MKWYFLWALLLIPSFASVRVQLNRETAPVAIAFTHVAVIDPSNSSVQPDMTVLILGDSIAEIGKAADFKMPKHARALDARGKFLMPGLWDMHVHTFTHDPLSTRTWFFPLLIANGVTGVRDMWTTGSDIPQVVKFRNGLADSSLPLPLASLVIYSCYWDWKIAAVHTIVVSTMMLLLIETLLLGFGKIPFTCNAPPFKDTSMVWFIVCILGFFGNRSRAGTRGIRQPLPIPRTVRHPVLPLGYLALRRTKKPNRV
jgi:hypothetical protein